MIDTFIWSNMIDILMMFWTSTYIVSIFVNLEPVSKYDGNNNKILSLFIILYLGSLGFVY